jgi:acetoin:2,6-dichlorophenolindophenol oxidoreductase subunit alpha
VLECKTYRHRGHFEGEAANIYRSSAEVNEWKMKDPIPRFEQGLRRDGVLTDGEADTIKQDIMREIDEAIAFAKDSPYPQPGNVATDVYTDLIVGG